MIRMPFVLEVTGIIVSQEERTVIQAVEVIGLERVRRPLHGQEPGRDLLPTTGKVETDADRMLQVPVHMHEHTRRRNEGDVAFHPAGTYIPPVGVDAVGYPDPPVVRDGDHPTVHPAFLPRNGFTGGIGRGEITEMLGIVQHLIVPRRPPRHVERHRSGTGSHGQIQVQQQVMPDGIHGHRIVHPVGMVFLSAAGCECGHA